jgi:hypothetical protein
MTTLYIDFPTDPNTLVLLNSRAEPNLLTHIEGRAQWILYQDQLRSMYHRQRLDGSDIPVEFINNEWYALLWKEGWYHALRNCCIPTTQLVQLGLGAWRITDPQHPNYIKPPQVSPVDLREPLPLYLGNSDKSTSSASAIDSPLEYQGRVLRFAGTTLIHAHIWHYCAYVMRVHCMPQTSVP